MKPVFSEKTYCKPKIMLVKGNDIIEKDDDLVETFNTFFKEAVLKLDIRENCDLVNFDVTELVDPVDIAIEKFKDHPSILKIKKMVSKTSEFNFFDSCRGSNENTKHEGSNYF